MTRALILASIFVFAACGREDTIGLGSDVPLADAGGGDATLPEDTGAPGDTGIAPEDTGTVAEDAGSPLEDAGALDDAGEPEDLGVVDVDASEDAGAEEDAAFDGSVDPDATTHDDAAADDASTDVDASAADATVSLDASVSDASANDGGSASDGGTSDAGAPACVIDDDCDDPGAPNCDTSSGQCVRCTDTMQCGFGRVCDLAIHDCRFSCFADQCLPGLVCETTQQVCVECVDNGDCNGAETCDMTTHECVECSDNTDCALRPGAPICDPATNTCVGCTSTSCTNGEICLDDPTECVAPMSRGLCEPCDDDDQCGGPDDLCIGLRVGAGFVDRSCAQDCTNSTCPSGFECQTVRGTFRQCRPSYAMQAPSCYAMRRLGQPCPYDPNGTDEGCGLENRQDARCVLGPNNTGICTIWCDDAADCPIGSTCVMAGAATGVCL